MTGRHECLSWREEFPHLAGLVRWLCTLALIVPIMFAAAVVGHILGLSDAAWAAGGGCVVGFVHTIRHPFPRTDPHNTIPAALSGDGE